MTTNMSVREKSLAYGAFFCSTLGVRACNIIIKAMCNIPIYDKLHINLFNSNTGSIEKYFFVEVLEYLFCIFDSNPTPNNNAQVCIGCNLFVSANIYNFLYDQWSEMNEKFTEGLYYDSLTGEYHQELTLPKNTYLDGFYAPLYTRDS